MPVRVLIVDDHEPVRRGIRSLLTRRADWTVCGEAADGFEAAELARKLRPDVVLMDLSMPSMDGAGATRIIRQEVPESQIIIVSQDDPTLVRDHAVQIGARGYVSKSTLARDLLPAILRIVGGPEESSSPEDGEAAAVSEEGRPSREERLFGGGDLGHLIRTHDWSATPLGPIESWPQGLRTAVNLMLNSQHPMWIGWGPEMTFLYNDAYISVLSLAKHPGSLGRPAREVWAEIWDVCGPLADKVFAKAEPSFFSDVRLFMSRGEYLEETYYSFSYSPIYDASGKVGGLFCPSAETTGKVLHARRLRTLSELSAKALVEKSVEAACLSSVETLSHNPDDVPFALLYRLAPEREFAALAGACRVPAGVERVSPLEIPLSSGPARSQLWPIREVSESYAPRVTPLGGADALPLGAARQPVKEALVLPVSSHRHARPVAVLIVGINPTRKLDSEYRAFFSLIADQVATAIQNATAAEEEKRRVEALAEIDRAKTQFFSNVSHEFRTPLTLMLGPLEDLLAQPAGLAPQQVERLDVAHRNSLRLLKLVNTLLDFSRIEAGRMQGTFEPTDLSQLTAELASVFRSTLEHAGLKFTIDCPPLGESTYVDREMWEKIVLNLLSNAFKFTFVGEIEVALSKDNGAVELRVRDTGTGIPPEDLPHVFERFHRVENARGRTIEGSGIGLALVQELVKLHGGTVQVASMLGCGTTFTVRVPRGRDHLPADRVGAQRTLSTALHGDAFVDEAMLWLPESERASLPGVAAAHPALRAETTLPRRARVLVAEDNADMREYVRRLLAPYEVELAADGEAALEAALQQPPDLVLTDVMMPRLDGFGLLRSLRADERTATIPVILLSARAGDEARLEGVAAGADDYLIKPFSARELAARVETHLRLSRLRREGAERERSIRLEAERNERRFRAIVETTPECVMLIGPDGAVLHINQPGLSMMEADSSESVAGRSVFDLIAPEHRERFREFNQRICQGEKGSIEFEVVGLHGTRRYMETHAAPLRQPDGSVIHLAVTRDISERKRAEEDYRQLAKTLDAQVRERTAELEERTAEVTRQSEQLRKLSWELLRAQDEERRRIARELHDSAGQILTLLGINLATLVDNARQKAPEVVRSAQEAEELVQQLTKEIRTTSYLLHPPLLDANGLPAALSWYVRGLTDRSGLDISLRISEQFGRLPRDVELLVFRLVQECLTNVHRHSGSTGAAVLITREPDQVQVEVRDQGRGIPPQKLAAIQKEGSGVGIRGMRERLRQFQGEMVIDSSSQGTAVLVTIPVVNEHSQPGRMTTPAV